MRFLYVVLAFFMVGCGGGGSSMTPTSNSSGPTPIDPSGNWTMTARDSSGKTLALAALFSQTGSIVTANSFTAAGNPNIVAPCVPFSVSFTNGLVQLGNQFSGTIGGSIGTVTFTSTLNPAGTHFDGTYAGISGCSGVAAAGTLTGDEVPSTSGSWTGTIQACNFDQQIGACTSLTGTSSAITLTLTQNDATGNVTGTYAVPNLAPFSTGTVSVKPPSDILSGTIFQFTLADATGRTFVANGGLDLQRGFHGAAIDASQNGDPFAGSYYAVAISH
jgi:hypothetical protein